MPMLEKQNVNLVVAPLPHNEGFSMSIPVSRTAASTYFKNPYKTFEVEIINPGTEGFVASGFVSPGYTVERMPGWERHSAALHSDDGGLYVSSGGARFTPVRGFGEAGKIIGVQMRDDGSIRWCLDGRPVYTLTADTLRGYGFDAARVVPAVGIRGAGTDVRVRVKRMTFNYGPTSGAPVDPVRNA